MRDARVGIVQALPPDSPRIDGGAALAKQAALESFVKGTTLTVRYAPTDALTASVPLKLEGLAAALNTLPR